GPQGKRVGLVVSSFQQFIKKSRENFALKNDETLRITLSDDTEIDEEYFEFVSPGSELHVASSSEVTPKEIQALATFLHRCLQNQPQVHDRIMGLLRESSQSPKMAEILGLLSASSQVSASASERKCDLEWFKGVCFILIYFFYFIPTVVPVSLHPLSLIIYIIIITYNCYCYYRSCKQSYFGYIVNPVTMKPETFQNEKSLRHPSPTLTKLVKGAKSDEICGGECKGIVLSQKPHEDRCDRGKIYVEKKYSGGKTNGCDVIDGRLATRSHSRSCGVTASTDFINTRRRKRTSIDVHGVRRSKRLRLFTRKETSKRQNAHKHHHEISNTY
ncbi:uncharacterized protein LOC119574914, partial [Penaeus monodon]|uniref:uncharacterized protein LOC119574914 n=1 Tax=Penaeus monodon TaxID=6687 RepID=UPI0018A7B8BB